METVTLSLYVTEKKLQLSLSSGEGLCVMFVHSFSKLKTVSNVQ